MTISNNDDCVLLQGDLTTIEAWSDLWYLPLNIKKCLLFKLCDIKNLNNVYILKVSLSGNRKFPFG